MQLHKQRRQRTRATVRLLLLLAAVVVVGCGLFLSISGFVHYRFNASGPLEADADKEFHLTIAAATQNKAMLETIVRLWRIRTEKPEVRQAYDSI